MKRRLPLRVVDFWHDDDPHSIKENALVQILAKSFVLDFESKPEVVLYANYGLRHRGFACTRIFFSGENVRPDFRKCDFALTFDWLDDPRHFRLPLYRLYPEYSELIADQVRPASISRDIFCGIVVSAAAPQERWEMFESLQRYKFVASAGRYRNNIGAPVRDKLSFLRRCKFAIVFENSSFPGYTTEKLLHALAAGCVPIYWGNPMVGRDFNTRAFVNCHDFGSWDAVAAHVRQVDENDYLYREYLAEPALPNGEPSLELSDERIIAFFERATSPCRRSVVMQARMRQDQARYRLGRWLDRRFKK